MTTRRPQSRGTCAYCGQTLAKGGMSRHLAGCPQRAAAIDAVNAKKRTEETLYHLRVQGVDASDFWLNLEVRGSSTPNHLDQYLRAIWLECCGHMSQFSVGGWGGSEIAKRRTVADVFKPDVTLTHIYDFGTSSETLLKYVRARQGIPTTRHPIALMARNSMPEVPCIECDAPASWLCMECMVEDDLPSTLCEKHAKTHPHDNYGEPMALVNSPRVGMCGYEGPAEPPY